MGNDSSGQGEDRGGGERASRGARAPLTDRPREVRAGAYVAVTEREETTPWGILTVWAIARDGVTVGKMFQGSAGYGERVTCSMRELVWSGKMPERSWDPKSAEHGLCFDTGPHDTREQALDRFGRNADRLIAWRGAQVSR